MSSGSPERLIGCIVSSTPFREGNRRIGAIRGDTEGFAENRRCDPAGANAVDPDTVFAELHRNRMSQLYDGRLGPQYRHARHQRAMLSRHPGRASAANIHQYFLSRSEHRSTAGRPLSNTIRARRPGRAHGHVPFSPTCLSAGVLVSTAGRGVWLSNAPAHVKSHYFQLL